ncbi:PrsW family glutamic-type intramembrane protease [Streptomyces sp. NPDC048669]|uniref:CdiA C-terminal domain-containing protein n=1 Tax=Streptomyces sp. NPDC048669 TaxID=3155267 RepID=UPI00344A1948
MALLMVAAAVWGVLQLFALAWPTRSVRLSTVLLALTVGVYGCGVVVAFAEVAYTRLYADGSGRPLAEVVDTTSYTVAPWVEELIKLCPLLLAGLYAKVRRQWGLADFVVLGSALGAGFGLLEALLRFAAEAKRAIPRAHGGWVIPDGLSPPYVPGPHQVFTSWLPAPFATLEMGQEAASATFSHLVWTALAGLGVGVLLRGRGWIRLLAAVPVAGAIGYHTLNNYAAQHYDVIGAVHWLEKLDAKSWLIPLICLSLAMIVDLRQLHHGKSRIPGVLLAGEREAGDSSAALIRYAAWRLPWTLLIAVRFVRLRRALCYMTALAPSTETEELRRLTANIAARIDSSDRADAWQGLDIRSLLKKTRAGSGRWRWQLVIPCLLALPSLIFLGIGSFHSTSGLQTYIATGPRPKILLYPALAALAWIAWQLTALLRTWRATAAQPIGEQVALHRFRITTALGSAAAGAFMLYRGLGGADVTTDTLLSSAHLLEALDQTLFWVGLLLFLVSMAALIGPGTGLAGLALAGGGALGGLTVEAAVNAALLGSAGIVLMGASANGGFEGTESERAGRGNEGKGSSEGSIDETEKTFDPSERKVAELLKSEGKHVRAQVESTEDGVRRGDAFVDGVETEFKSLDPGATSGTVKNQLNKAKGQARHAIVDARGSGLSEDAAREGVIKFFRNNPPGRMDTIRVVGDNFNLAYP